MFDVGLALIRPRNMRALFRITIILCLFPLVGIPVPAQSETDKAARAKEIILQARTALGGEDVFNQVQSLSASGRLRRFTKYVRVSSPEKVEEKDTVLKSKVEFDFLFPEKFKKREKGSDVAGWSYDRHFIVNGNEAWVYPPLPAPSTRRNRMIVDVDEAERSYQQQAAAVQADLTRVALSWLFKPLPSFPVNLSYEGIFNDGSINTHAISIRGPEGFSAALLLDQQTYRPVSLIYIANSLREEIVVSASGFSRRWIAQTYARARREAAMRAAPPRLVQVKIAFSDYRSVQGLLLPHQMTTLHDNKPVSELVISEFSLNDAINPKKFQSKDRR
ncbi:MAG TPA: hypothetical protein VEF04_16710 [Blastocatellia bacterium]|nr:hypothetical protein [Blastocatellia bacterium]